MADILLAAAIKKTVEISSKLAVEEGARLFRLREDINWMEGQLRHLQSYLEAVEASNGDDSKVRNLTNDIKELARDVEDILEKFAPQIESFSCLKTVACIFPYCNTAYKFSLEIEKIKVRIKAIDDNRKTFGIMDTSRSVDAENWDLRRSYLHADEPEVIGLDDDCKNLEAKLLDEKQEHRFISIIGMPGLGKTTLAKKIYNQVQPHFDCSALVYVSQEPNIRELLKGIARQVGLDQKNKADYSPEKKFFKSISSFRYLRVLSLQFDGFTSGHFPDEFWNLIHLSYIRFRGVALGITMNISNLKNLLTLDIQDCGASLDILKMKQLRHLLLSDMEMPMQHYNCMCHPASSTEVCLENLQTLKWVSSAVLEQIGMHNLPNLRRLGIDDLSKNTFEKLCCPVPPLAKLEELTLNMARMEKLPREVRGERWNLSRHQSLVKLHVKGHVFELPNVEGFPPNLVKLSLHSFNVKEDPMRTLKQLPKLKILKLESHTWAELSVMNCSGADSFPQLEMLHIHYFQYLKELISDDVGLPKLKKVIIRNCGDVQKITGRIQSVMGKSQSSDILEGAQLPIIDL
nr:disease resistance RPP8-like protein 3 isoform X1 [Ipomoea batatas]